MIKRLKKLDRKSAFCITIGFYYIVSGLASLSTPKSVQEISKSYGYKVIFDIFPLSVWSWLFIALGTASILASLCKQNWLAFGLLQGQSAWWALLFITNFFITGYKNSLVFASAYVVYGVLLFIVSGWKEKTIEPCTLLHWKAPV